MFPQLPNNANKDNYHLFLTNFQRSLHYGLEFHDLDILQEQLL